MADPKLVPRDPKFNGGLKKEARIVSLVIDFEDGTRELLEFADNNRAFYTVFGINDRLNQFDRHEIKWKENHA